MPYASRRIPVTASSYTLSNMHDEKYEQLGTIGEGQYGKVFLVSDRRQPARRYALKKIPKDTCRIDAQPEILPRLVHPNIVRTVEVIRQSAHTSIVLEFALGGDLHEHVSRQYLGSIPEATIIDWATQIALALFYLHNEQHIIHRDIKTRNILVMADGLLKVADFGVARKLDSAEDFARSSVGTPYYLSPESVESGRYNNKSDIWSFGCVLYELTSRRRPFQAASIGDLMAKIVNDPCQEIPLQFSKWLRELISSMLSKNLEKRPSIQTILEMEPIRRAFADLKAKYKVYESIAYPEQTLRTTKYLEREDRLSSQMKIFSSSLKTAKKDKLTKTDIQHNITMFGETHKSKVDTRFEHLSLRYLIDQARLSSSQQQQTQK